MEQILTHSLAEYGILGIILIAFGYILYGQWKMLIKKNNELEEKVDNLQKQMIQLVSEERDTMRRLIEDNTEALRELREIIFEILKK